MSLCCGRRKNAHKSAFVKSSALRWIRGDLQFNDSLPRPDYIHRLIDHFHESSSPESMRRVVLSPDKILCEYASASCHLPGSYVEFFPCPHCTYRNDHGSFVEVFHFSNVHEPRVCATVTFDMPAERGHVIRVNVYANRAARECLTVATFDRFRRTVHFFKGNVPLADLKSNLRRTTHNDYY